MDLGEPETDGSPYRQRCTIKRHFRNQSVEDPIIGPSHNSQRGLPPDFKSSMPMDNQKRLEHR